MRVCRCTFGLLVWGATVSCGGGGAAPPDDDGVPNAAPQVSVVLLNHLGQALTGRGASIGLPGDTVHVSIDAQDDRDLDWIGFRASGGLVAADSVRIPDSLRTAALRLIVHFVAPGSFTGTVNLEVFGKDNAGLRTSASPASGPVRYPAVRETLYGGGGSGGLDYAQDLRHPAGGRRTYWVRQNPNELGTDDGSSLIPINLPGPPQSLDVTNNRDTFLVALPTLDAYGLVDARVGVRSVTLVPDTVTAVDGVPWMLRVGSNNHAIVYRKHPSDPAIGSVVDLDLNTGSQRLVAEVATDGHIERSVDRSRILLWEAKQQGARAQLYDASTGFFSPIVPLSGPMATNASIAGSWAVIGMTLYQLPTLTPQAVFTVPRVSGLAVLSPRDQTLAVITSRGLVRLRISDGAAHDMFFWDARWTRLLQVPEGNQYMMPQDGESGPFRNYIDLPLALPINLQQERDAAPALPTFSVSLQRR